MTALRSMRSLAAFTLRQAVGAGAGAATSTRALTAAIALLAIVPVAIVIALPPLAERLLPRVDPNLELETIRRYASNPSLVLDVTRYLATMTAPLVVVCVLVVPELMSHDRRSGLLATYLRSPLGASGYVATKLAVAAMAVFAVTGFPLLALVVGHRLTGRDDFGVSSSLEAVARAVAAGAVVAVVYAALGIAAGALTARRLSAAGGVAVTLVAAPAVTRYLAVGAGFDPVLRAVDPTQAALALGTRIAGGPAMEGVGSAALVTTVGAWMITFLATTLIAVRRS